MGFRALGISQRVFGVEGIVYEKARWLVLRY